MAASENKSCVKCGAPVNQSAAFCPACGNPTGNAPVTPPARAAYWNWKEYRMARRKGDKLGPIVGGLIVIWLGITLYLAQTPYIIHSQWWGYFFIGVGIILIASGLFRWNRFSYRYPPVGYLIGGLFLLIIGLAGVIQASFFGPGLLIAIGVVIIIVGAYAIRKPVAKSEAPPPA